MVLSESQIERKMCKIIRQRGGLCYKFTSPGNSGVPDRIIITPNGRTIFAELKSDTGKLSKVQEHQIARMRNNHADVRIIKGWTEAQEFIDEVFPK